MMALLILFMHINAAPSGFRQAFPEEYKKALTYLTARQSSIARISKKCNTDWKEVIAIGFPELVRYSIFQDFLETKADELLYIRGGAGLADFSIGPFQLKPSFAEDIENRWLKRNDLKNIDFKYSTADAFEIRKQRVERLSDIEWQLKYLNAFYLLAADRCAQLQITDKAERLHYSATLFNCGLNSDDTKVKAWATKNTFPYGYKHHGTQFNYGNIAIEFNQLIHQSMK